MSGKKGSGTAAAADAGNANLRRSNGHAIGTATEAEHVEAAAGEDNSLDAILVRIGQFGRFQIINYVLLCVPMVFNAFFSISYVFTASTVEHRYVLGASMPSSSPTPPLSHSACLFNYQIQTRFRCNITQCDSPASSYEESWLNFTVPYKNSAWDSCNRYVNLLESESSSVFSTPSSDVCAAEYFGNSTESCGTDFKFRDEEKTISTEVNIQHKLLYDIFSKRYR